MPYRFHFGTLSFKVLPMTQVTQATLNTTETTLPTDTPTAATPTADPPPIVNQSGYGLLLGHGLVLWPIATQKSQSQTQSGMAFMEFSLKYL